MGFGSKERPRNGIFRVLSARKMGREPKKAQKDGGGRGEGRKLASVLPLPSPLFYSLHFSRCNSLLPNPTETLATQANLKRWFPPSYKTSMRSKERRLEVRDWMISSPFCAASEPQCLWVSLDGMRIEHTNTSSSKHLKIFFQQFLQLIFTASKVFHLVMSDRTKHKASHP